MTPPVCAPQDDDIKTVNVEWPYVSSEYTDPQIFYNQELPREPFPEHVINKETGEVADKRKWAYHYNQVCRGSEG